MKLATDITPRRDGTVTAVAESGTKYVFSADEAGRLVVDVTDQADLEFLLDAGFFPADEADFEEVLKEPAVDPDADDPGAGGENAAPVEANTPPKPKAKGRK